MSVSTKFLFDDKLFLDVGRNPLPLANQGTLLLDEIGELSLAAQAKLLRVLQEGEFVMVGGRHVIERGAILSGGGPFRLAECDI